MRRRCLRAGTSRQHLFHRGLAPAIPLDDRRLERQAAQLRNLQRHLAGPGVQLPVVAASTRVLATLRLLVLPRTAKMVRSFVYSLSHENWYKKGRALQYGMAPIFPGRSEKPEPQLLGFAGTTK